MDCVKCEHALVTVGAPSGEFGCDFRAVYLSVYLLISV